MKNKLELTKYYLASLALFLAPIKGLVITVGFCIVLDTFLGIYATIKNNGWSSFESNKFFNLTIKSFFYMFTIFLGYLIDFYVIEGELFGVNNLVSKSTTILWVIIELKSIDENSVKLGNKPIMDVVKSILDKMKSIKNDINQLK